MVKATSLLVLGDPGLLTQSEALQDIAFHPTGVRVRPRGSLDRCSRSRWGGERTGPRRDEYRACGADLAQHGRDRIDY
jgi:hypothetical protein